MKLVVVGSVGLDDVETPFGKVERALGGSAVYFSLSAAYYASAGFVGVVGSDFPAEGLQLLRDKKVDLRGLETREGETFRWGGRYGYDLNERDTLFTELNVFESFAPVLPDDYRDAPYLFLGNIDPELQLDVLDQIRSPELVALDTMNFWIEGKPDELARVLERVDLLMINDGEARELAGTPNIVRAANEIRRMGPETIVIKRGEYGALVTQATDEFFFAPAYPLEDVLDPTGAGDSFAGGFMGFVAREGRFDWSVLCQATVAGSTLASYCVEDFSVARLAELTRQDLDARAEQFRELTRFEPLRPVSPAAS